MTDKPDPEKLAALDAKIRAAQKTPETGPKKANKYTAAGQAWQMVIELTAGMVIGVLIGLGLDHLTGWEPLFVITFTLLGFGAGVRVMMQTAKFQQQQHEAKASQEDKG